MSRFLAAYQSFFSKMTDAPYEFGHAGGIACLSTIALGRRWIERGQGGIKPNIFLMLVAGSSAERKSTTVDAAIQLLKDVDTDRVGPSDFTAEGLLSHMARKNEPTDGSDPVQRSKLIVPMSEFGQYLATSGSYGATTPGTLCTLYDGGDYERVRSGAPPIYISKPRVTVFAAVAFGMLEKYADPKDWSTGFFNRFMWITPSKVPRERFHTQPIFPAAEYDQCRASLYDLSKELEALKRPMVLDPEAEKVVRRLSDAIPSLQNDPVESAQRERLMTAVAKLSMLYQIDIDPSATIGGQAMEAACNFAMKSWESFRLVYARTATNDFGRLAERLTAYIANAGTEGVAKSQVLRSFGVQAAQLQAVVDLLVRFEKIEMREVTNPAMRGPGSKRVMLYSREDNI